MDPRYRELERMALQLDEADRERLLDALMESLAGSEPALSEEWSREIERRVAAFDSGNNATVSAEALLSELRQRLR